MIEVFGDHAQRIDERMLGKFEPDAMLSPIDTVFRSVPFEIGHQPGNPSYMEHLPYLRKAGKMFIVNLRARAAVMALSLRLPAVHRPTLQVGACTKLACAL